MRLALASLACAVLFTVSSSAWAETPRELLEARKRAAPNIEGQVKALAWAAWHEPELGHETTSLAWKNVVDYGAHAMTGLRAAVNTVRPEQTADVVLAMLEARRSVSAGIAIDYHAGLRDALWVGSEDARRLALAELALYRDRFAMLPAIDSAYEYPDLTGEVIDALVLLREDRARHFLLDVMTNNLDNERDAAAVALAEIGGRATDTLRDATVSTDPELRSVAIEALLPRTAVDDLTTLYEYLTEHPDDDPTLLNSIRLRAFQLEALLDAQLEREAEGEE